MVVSPILPGLHLLKRNFHQILCVLVVEIKIMPVHEFGILTKYSRSGSSDKPMHPHSLTRAFPAHIIIAIAYI